MRLSEIKKALPRLSMHVQYDPKQYLREKPIDVEVFNQLIEKASMYLRQILQELEEDVDVNVLVYLYGYLGNAFRIAGQTQKSIRYLNKSLELAYAESDEIGVIRTLIRLGEAYKYHGQHEPALECFEKALTMTHTRELHKYKDFALQHMGKCLLELGEYENALLRFEEALLLRQKKGDESLILATETAIVMTQIMKNE